MIALSQLPLFRDTCLEVDSLESRFWRFHRDNPSVFSELRKLALDILGTGCDRWSINGLFEVLRWQRAMRTTGDPFKLNNDYRAFYARLLMREESRLKNFFATRMSASDDAIEVG